MREALSTFDVGLIYVQRLAGGNEWRRFEPLRKGINVEAGKVVHPALQGMG